MSLMFPELAESFFTTSATWEAQAVSKGVFRGGCGLRETLSSLSADEWDCVPALWLFDWRVPYGLLGGAGTWHQNGSLQDS